MSIEKYNLPDARNYIDKFIQESNRIEGIHEEVSSGQQIITSRFLSKQVPIITDIESWISWFQPDARLRTNGGMNVVIAQGTKVLHRPPAGGIMVKLQLEDLLARLTTTDPYTWHHEYETLHPFTDCNGRSGRVLWLWQMIRLNGGRLPELGFLHMWYYQSLRGCREV